MSRINGRRSRLSCLVSSRRCWTLLPRAQTVTRVVCYGHATSQPERGDMPQLAAEQVSRTGHDAGWRVVVHSIGGAGAAIVRVLAQVMPIAAEKLAELLYQAPAELLSGLEREEADQVAELLARAGLDCEVVGADHEVTPGSPEFDVAMVIGDECDLRGAAALVMEVLGVDAATARDLVCASPAALVGRVSQATVDALRDRFAAIGIDLDVSRPSASHFDVFLGECAPADRHRAVTVLHDIGIEPDPDAANHGQPVLATGLAADQSARLWERIRRTALPVRIINRDFQRFDLSLDTARPSPDLAHYLAQATGMPAEAVPAVLRGLPVVLLQNIDAEELATHLDALRALGATGTGHSLSFETFRLFIDEVGDVEATAQLLQRLGGLTAPAAAEALAGTEPAAVPFTRNRARWLQHELARVGTATRIVMQ